VDVYGRGSGRCRGGGERAPFIDDRTLRRLTLQAPHAHDANAEAEQAQRRRLGNCPRGRWNEPHRLGLEDSRLSDRVVEPDGWTWRGRAQEANQEVIGAGDDRVRAILKSADGEHIAKHEVGEADCRIDGNVEVGDTDAGGDVGQVGRVVKGHRERANDRIDGRAGREPARGEGVRQCDWAPLRQGAADAERQSHQKKTTNEIHSGLLSLPDRTSHGAFTPAVAENFQFRSVRRLTIESAVWKMSTEPDQAQACYCSPNVALPTYAPFTAIRTR
jgi:hypothetical protein